MHLMIVFYFKCYYSSMYHFGPKSKQHSQNKIIQGQVIYKGITYKYGVWKNHSNATVT